LFNFKILNFRKVNRKLQFLCLLQIVFTSISSQNLSWKICNAPAFGNRVDDIFMLDAQTGYAVCGDSKVVKTIDGGDNWTLLNQVGNGLYCRSVEFINTQKGFVGGFYFNGGGPNPTNVLRKTLDGGTTWTDITTSINPIARKGICGLAVADSSTIYGCGNWYQDSAYIVKSADGGNTWGFINMSAYATSLIDMHFINADTGFATGRGLAPLKSGVILYTTDGGLSWTYKFQNNVSNEYCWKIQKLTDSIYFASLEDFNAVPSKILKSIDGGMTWTIKQVLATNDNMEGVGFINANKGWAGGGSQTYESNDGGNTWATINICQGMNRVFKVNDSLLFASGSGKIWKYSPSSLNINSIKNKEEKYAALKCSPNPAKEKINITVNLFRNTRALLIIYDEKGKEIKVIENNDKSIGEYKYAFSTNDMPSGLYYVVLKTHEAKEMVKVIVNK
jgi:photosystem II stability/assembly factor-like uncharacterized protein